MDTQSERLTRYLSVLNLPLDAGLSAFTGGEVTDENNWYFYLKGLQVISESEYGLIRSGTGRVQLNAALKSFVTQSDRYFSVHGVGAMRVADLGCGWGFQALWFAMSAHKTVYAIGYPSQIAHLQRIYKLAGERNLIGEGSKIIALASPLTLHSVSLAPEIAPESLDKVILNDVIEHFHPSLYPNLAVAAYASLRKGGKLISKSHNSDNRRELAKLRQYWDGCEKEHLIGSRKKYIGAHWPALPEHTVQLLAERTRGLTELMVRRAVELYLSTGEIAAPYRHAVPVDIGLDNYMLENHVSPRLFRRFLSGYGFDVRTYPCLHSSRRLRIFAPAARVAPNLMLKVPFFSAAVLLVAKKR